MVNGCSEQEPNLSRTCKDLATVDLYACCLVSNYRDCYIWFYSGSTRRAPPLPAICAWSALIMSRLIANDDFQLFQEVRWADELTREELLNVTS
jgi:hypothetical protein